MPSPQLITVPPITPAAQHAARLFAASGAVLRAAGRTWAQRRQARADLRQLHALDAQQLRDIGLTHDALPPLPPKLVLGDDWRSWHRL